MTYYLFFMVCSPTAAVITLNDYVLKRVKAVKVVYIGNKYDLYVLR